MPRTPKEKIQLVLSQAYDAERVSSLYRQQCYAFGDAWDKQIAIIPTDGRIIDCPDITLRYLEIGQSRRMTNAALISMSRVMYSQPAPEFPQVDKFTAEVRKQFLLARADGEPDADWATEDAMAYLDGDGLGFGCVQIVLTTNPKTDRQRVGIRHVPVHQVIGDRHQRNPSRWRFVAFVHYLSREEAQEKYGWKNAAEYVQPLFSASTGMYGKEPLEVMRVIEYFDLGFSKNGRPTRAVLARDIEGPVLEYEDNDFETLPFAHFNFYNPSGMRFPVGRILLQMPTAEAINEVERYMRDSLAKPPIDLVDTNQLNQDDLARYVRGEKGPPIRFQNNPASGKAFERIPGMDAQNTVLQWSNMLERQYNTDSGQSELDRGNQLAETRTLGEAELMANRSSVQGVWSKLQAVKFHQRKFMKALEIAARFDRDPIELDIFGYNIKVNDPEEPASTITNFLADRSKCVISEDALEFQDLNIQRSQKTQELVSMSDLVQAHLVDPTWWAEERLKALGYDPKEAMPQQGPGGPPGQPPAGGQAGVPAAQGQPLVAGPGTATLPMPAPSLLGAGLVGNPQGPPTAA
jgi:hypothetical protein